MGKARASCRRITFIPYRCEFYGDVLHGRITNKKECYMYLLLHLLFFAEEGGSGAIRTRTFSVKEKYIMPYIGYRASTCTAFATETAGNASGLAHISALSSLSFTAMKGKARASCRRITFIPYSGEFYGDVLHERITKKRECYLLLHLFCVTLNNTFNNIVITRVMTT